uniref:AMP-dependent synthetase/ligase domain-containing protein n=1 Tax=Plectus sambesii TaxID=2011161 RepID=A0A914VN81_9BILA
GTTGEPKPVLLNHFQLLNSCLVTGKRLKLDAPNQVLCCPMPIFRGPVMCLAAMATAVFGTPVVYPSALPLPPAIFKSLQEYKLD